MSNILLEDLGMYYEACKEVEYGKLNEGDKRELHDKIDEYRRTHTEEF